MNKDKMEKNSTLARVLGVTESARSFFHGTTRVLPPIGAVKDEEDGNNENNTN
jgi:hypothetical protein